MKRRIPIDLLKPGMFVSEIKNISWMKTPFLRNRRLIKNEEEIEALRDCGVCEVSIDAELGDDLEPQQLKQFDHEPEIQEEETNAQAVPSSSDEGKQSQEQLTGEPAQSENQPPPSPTQEQSTTPQYIDFQWDADSNRKDEIAGCFNIEQALSHMDGDEELLTETIQIFLEEYPKILAAIQTAVDNQDAKTVEREAHSVKGAVSNLGATAAYESALRLEKIGSSENLGPAPDTLSELALELRQLEKLLFGFQEYKKKQGSLQHHRPTTPILPQGSGFSPEVIVVDHLGSTRETLCGLLRQQGISQIRQVEDAAGALEVLRASSADLVISDWNLPGMTGLELLRTIRNDPDLEDVPFLMATGSATRNEVMEAAQAGVSGYLLKPFTADILVGQLQKIFPDQPSFRAAA